MVSLHVPLNQHTRKLIDSERLALLRKGSVLLNFSRAGIVNEDHVQEALDQGFVSYHYVQFPSHCLKIIRKWWLFLILAPPLWRPRSNCAVMVIENVRNTWKYPPFGEFSRFGDAKSRQILPV